MKLLLITFVVISFTASQCLDGKRLLAMFSINPQAYYYLLKNHHRLPEIDNFSTSVEHLRVFANDGHLQAKVLLAEFYRDNSALFQSTLHSAAMQGALKAQQRLIEHYIETEQWQELMYLPWPLDDTTNAQAHMALQLPIDSTWQTKTLFNQTHCADKVLLAVTNLNSFRAAQSLKKRFEKLYSLPICLSEPVYFYKTQIDCSNFPAARLECRIIDELALKHYSFDKLVIIGQSGIANASGNTVRINASQSEKVLLHELMHLYGFIDEYPLRKSLAKKLCDVSETTQIAKNILVVPTKQKDHDKIYFKNQIWFKTHTCDYGKGLAYKPTPETTNLELLDLPVPKHYLTLLEHALY